MTSVSPENMVSASASISVRVLCAYAKRGGVSDEIIERHLGAVLEALRELQELKRGER